jgi:hypothetical protein
MAGLMYEQPDDPLAYIQLCITQLKQGNQAPVWNQFINNNNGVATSSKQSSSVPTKTASDATNTVVAPTHAPKESEPLNAIFVLGGPGSGKGTQCARLVSKFNVDHISVGDLLRDEVNSKSKVGLEIDGIMREGKMVPLQVVLNVLKARLAGLDGTRCVLIDGFPREMQQALEFEQKVCCYCCYL